MSDYSDFRERDLFDSHIFDIIKEYLDNDISLVAPAFICINNKSLDISIENIITESSELDYYPISDYIRINGNEREVDADATYELASSYIFI